MALDMQKLVRRLRLPRTVVEPFAHERLEDNLNPVARVFYWVPTLVCTPNSRSQRGAACVGAPAGVRRIADVVARPGFTRFRRSTQTPFNRVLEARPHPL